MPPGQIALHLRRNEDAIRDIPQAFKISRYHITVRQFRAFWDAEDGYRQPDWWQGFDTQRRLQFKQERSIGTYPVSEITWYEAYAFCRWLEARYEQRAQLPKDYSIRLPFEWEWEHAAYGGGDPTKYPWGNTWSEGSNPANILDSGLNRIIAVGMYPIAPGHNAPLDMAGNVMEWCWNERRTLDISLPNPANEHNRVLRGSSWHCEKVRVDSSYREDSAAPSTDSKFVGFRVVLAPRV